MSARPHTRPLALNRPPRSGNRYPRWLAAALALLLTLTLVPATGAIAADFPGFLHADTAVSANSDASSVATSGIRSDADSDPVKLAEGKSGSGQPLAIGGIRVAILIPLGTLLLMVLGAVAVMIARRRVEGEVRTR
jgi:hypothetical protein